nr:hypothetical protein BaRGS_023335 [Batillaria attramentaria]
MEKIDKSGKGARRTQMNLSDTKVMYIYYLLGYKILANAHDTHHDNLADTDSASDIVKKNGDGGGILGGDPVKLTTSELRRRRRTTFFSRSAIFNYVSPEVQAQAENTYILALDGDVDFKPDAVRLLLDRMKKNKKVGAACGRIHPIGSGPIVWYQKFEYAIGHWLQKATEHVFGCVQCAPGCFTLFRGSALMDDNVARTYAMRATQAGHYVQFDQGEDRWLSTLLLQQGYRIDYCAASDALTHAPETFSEFFNQRRRWGPSTLANQIDLIGHWRTSVRMNDNLSTIYMFYQSMMLVSALLGPATIILLMAGSFRVMFKVTVVESYVLTLLGPIIYLFLCIFTKPSVQLSAGAILSAVYALVMTIVLVGTVGTAVSGSITSPDVIFLSTVIFIFLVSALLHPQELYCFIPGIMYLILIPAGYLVLTIYFLTNLHVVSWGTRETQHPATQEAKKEHAHDAKKKKDSHKEEQPKGGLLGWFGMHTLVQELRQLFKQVHDMIFQSVKRTTKKKTLSRTEQLLEELIVEMRRGRGEDTARIVGTKSVDNDQAEEEELVQNVQNTEDVQDAQEDHELDSEPEINSASHSSIADDIMAGDLDDGVQGSSPSLRLRTDNLHEPAWLDTLICGEGPVTKLSERERMFWAQLIHKYLYPLPQDRGHVAKISSDLRTLRNNVVFGFFMVSALWVALTMQLEVLQNELQDFVFFQIPRFGGGPTLKFQPLGLFFLATFGLILLTQFIGMFAHRWGTMLHTLSITQLGFGRREKEHKKVRDIIMRVTELQKLRNIELEPEPDYDEPLPDYDNEADDLDRRAQGHVIHIPDSVSGARPSYDFDAVDKDL